MPCVENQIEQRRIMSQHLDFLENALKNKNVQALLSTIRKCEGTDAKDGYSYIFGSSKANNLRFTGFKSHPRIKRPFGKTFSDAAGAYQIMSDTYDDLSKRLGLSDFTPHTQDLMCVELISQRGQLQNAIDGKFDQVIKGINTIWASLPGSPYGQPTHTLTECIVWYANSGGTRLTA
jgi:muramidase (phage lysozyme)